MRRISRESVYTARIIDLGARTINAILAGIPDCARVHVEHVDRLDRPTLKVLARAMLLQPAHAFSWIWHSISDPTVIYADEADQIFTASRQALLRQLVSILAPSLELQGPVLPLARPTVPAGHVSIYSISAALVIQNYDACFLWCDVLLKSSVAAERAEGLRLKALAAINVGKAEEALQALHLAEEMAPGGGRRAHLCYLQGLVEAKRSYDLASSTAHYERGLAALEESSLDGEDVPLERGWLFNGLALNEAILWRRSPDAGEHHTRAFNLVRDAFSLVRDGVDPARIYLRFNLLANSAFLMEMRGNYDLAISIFERAFDFEASTSPVVRRDGRIVMAYRLGVLHYRAGRLEEAQRLLGEAAQQDSELENWATQERILRAGGIVALARGAHAAAAQLFTRGLELCRAARSAEGTREHSRGLITTFILEGEAPRARDVYETLLREEGLAVCHLEQLNATQLDDALRPSAPAPKLPAYIPEIDLEEIPPIDINRFLVNAAPLGASGVAPWKD